MWRPKWESKENKYVEEPWNCLHYDAEEEEMVWLRKCYIGQVHNPDADFLLQNKLLEDGLSSIRVTLMSGDLVLIKVANGEDFSELVKEVEDLFENWFKDLRPWTPTEVEKEHYAWIRCQGVPLQVWNGEFFEKLVSSLGRYVSMDSTTMSKKRFDVARVMIQTSSLETITRIIKVKINGVFFSIRLVEEPFPDSIVSPCSHEVYHWKAEKDMSDGSET